MKGKAQEDTKGKTPRGMHRAVKNIERRDIEIQGIRENRRWRDKGEEKRRRDR
jgi:hypothetical protein